jgi:hypothetical protein
MRYLEVVNRSWSASRISALGRFGDVMAGATRCDDMPATSEVDATVAAIGTATV